MSLTRRGFLKSLAASLVVSQLPPALLGPERKWYPAAAVDSSLLVTSSDTLDFEMFARAMQTLKEASRQVSSYTLLVEPDAYRELKEAGLLPTYGIEVVQTPGYTTLDSGLVVPEGWPFS